MRAANVAWHPNGSTIAFTADDGWQNEQAYEQPDIYTVDDERRGEAAHQRRLRVELAVVFARRAVPVVRADVRHRHDHREEADARRLGRSDRVARRPAARRSISPRRGISSRTRRAGRRIRSSSTSPPRRAAPRTCSAWRRAPARRSSRSRKGERRVNSITFDKAMTRIAYTVGTYESPSDVWTANIDGTGEKRLTDLFADIRAEIGITKTERITWKSNDGTEIEGLAHAAVRIQPAPAVRIRSWSSITAARTPPSATASTSSSSTSPPTATSCSTPTSAARPATAMRSSGRRGARGARRTARTWCRASTT